MRGRHAGSHLQGSSTCCTHQAETYGRARQPHILHAVYICNLTLSIGCLCSAAGAINEHLGTSNVTPLHLDVAQFDNIRSFVKDFLARNEPLHILINNAGSMLIRCP